MNGSLRGELAGTGCAIPQRDDHRHDGAAGEDRRETDHRGLHGDGCTENSLTAFRAAVAAGLGIECDIQRSLDDWPMVFHDWDFARLLGRPDEGERVLAAEWQELRYANGASELMAEVFGEAGKHARSAVGVPVLPLGAAVEVDAIVALKP